MRDVNATAPSDDSKVLKDSSIHQLSLLSNNLDESKAFYLETLGARYVAEFSPPGLLFFQFAATRLLLETNGKPGTVYFSVNNIESSYAQLKARGVNFISEIQATFTDEDGLFGDKGVTEYMAFFHDPSENLLALVERRAAAD